MRFLRTLSALALLLAAVASPAAALPALAPVLVDANARDINATAYDTNVVIDGQHVWVCYVNSGLQVILADGDLPAPTWRRTVIANNNTDDAHNLCAVGIDPGGLIHVVWNLHGSALNYMRSTAPRDPATLVSAAMGGAQPAQVTYPRFHRAGAAFYFFARSGVSGAGDAYVKTWSGTAWSDLAYPLIQGAALSPTDNPYLGAISANSAGDVSVVWTARVGGTYNAGLYFAKYKAGAGQWQRSSGAPYTLPMSRLSGEVVVSAADTTVGNAGLGVSTGSDGVHHVVYTRLSAGGYIEVYYARGAGTGWTETQISDARAPRYRMCPTGPVDGAPRPCDVEVTGPTLVQHSAAALSILYSVTGEKVRDGGAAYARPGGMTYVAETSDGGLTWSRPREVHHGGVLGQSSEVQRASGGEPYVLMQESGIGGAGALWLASVGAPGAAPILEAWTASGPASFAPVHISASGFTIAAQVRPVLGATPAPMSIVDKGGANGAREYRLLLYGANLGAGFGYYPDRVQILLGSPSGAWSINWTPQVTVPASAWTDVVVTGDGATVRLYVNGVEAAATAYSGSFLATPGPVVVGGITAADGSIQYPMRGDVELAVIPRCLSADEVAAMFRRG